MGKLADLWKELKDTKSESERNIIKEKINQIEQWCIDNNFGDFKTITDWSKPQFPKKKKKDGHMSFSLGTDKGFCSYGNMILPKYHFCKCGIYNNNDLITAKEGFIIWKT